MSQVNSERLPSRVRFLHAVGKSTLRQGITVPINAQPLWTRQLERGESIPVRIRFDSDRFVDATLRRINNALGHLQFRYEGKKQSHLREYLHNEFGLPNAGGNSPLEVVEVGNREFRFSPLAGDRGRSPALTICRPLFHRISAQEAKAIPQLHQLCNAFATVEYEPTDGQREYNGRIAHALAREGWRKEVRLLRGIGLRIDFECNGVWIEVEFGNARSYYQDYIKLALAHRHCSARCGVLLCPTELFANMLCELGRRRAATKHAHREKTPTYSGMMTFEKAARELPFVDFLLPNPLIVAGIHLSRGVDVPWHTPLAGS